jgi:hypothetical protein
LCWENKPHFTFDGFIFRFEPFGQGLDSIVGVSFQKSNVFAVEFWLKKIVWI